jgi:YjbE family integral membrane protein
MNFFAILSHISGVHITDLSSLSFWLSLASIIVIDLTLSGDNAVLIAMACRSLPKQQQRSGIIFGTLGAIFLRIVLGSIAVYVLSIPFLKAVGGLIIIWIALNLSKEEEVKEVKTTSFWSAVRLIIIANIIMSLDNMLGVAGAAHGKPGLLWFGILVSIPLVIYGSQLMLNLMQKFPWIVQAGVAILGWTAGSLIITDPLIQQSINPWLSLILTQNTIIPLILAISVVLLGQKMQQKDKKAHHETSKETA